MKKPPVYYIIALLSVIVLLTGCKNDTKLKKNSISLDNSKKQNATVTDTEGAGFTVESGNTKATVVALPGTFPAGTSVTIAPLSKDKGLKGEKLSTFFELKAIKDGKIIQPSLPVFISLEVDSDLPDSACLVVYDDGESVGYKEDSKIIREDGITYITAELNHFTIAGIGEDGKNIRVTPVPRIRDGEWKEWRFEVNGRPTQLTYAQDNDMWDFEGYMRLTAVNTSSYIRGTYSGYPVIVITGKAKKGLPTDIQFTGNIKLKLDGSTVFDLTPLPPKNKNVHTELLPGDPRVDVGEFLSGNGFMDLFGEASLDVGLKGPNVLPDAGYEGTSEGGPRTYDCSVVVSSKGAFIDVYGIGIWKAVMVGVPKNGIPVASSGTYDYSADSQDPLASLASSDFSDPSDTNSSGASDPLGSLLNLTQTGWPKDDIPGSIPVYNKGEVINSGKDGKEYIILVDNTSEDDLNEYLRTLANNGWYTSSDYANEKNLYLYFQFNSDTLLQISVFVEELGTWPADELPADIVPPEKGILIGEVDIYHDSDSNSYNINFVYNGLSEDDVREYMESYLEEGWEGDEYMISKTIKWKGKSYKVNIEPMPDGDNIYFQCNMFEEN